ncbi:hypothetical protein SAY86_025879 [Trapa natans]|uniref:Uncharacterized protein n=1 Tax=Trapa natans TaxID=22666 RepID=A0AAN7KGY5_TRANT|nr:hypothetical protein SAY86_025879 [Trapa natans]
MEKAALGISFITYSKKKGTGETCSNQEQPCADVRDSRKSIVEKKDKHSSKKEEKRKKHPH